MGGPPRQSLTVASARRSRRESVSRMLCVSSGASFRSVVKSRRLMTSSRSGVSATTLAERGPPSSRLISPKYCPGPSRERLRGVTSTRAWPSRIRKKSLPAVPVRASTVSAGTSRISLMRAIRLSCLREHPCSRLTSSSRWIRSSWLIRPPKKLDRKSTRLNSSHLVISYAVFCLKKKKKKKKQKLLKQKKKKKNR